MKSSIRHLLVDSPGLAHEVVQRLLGTTDLATRKLFDLGAIYLNKIRLSSDQRVNRGDYLRIHPTPKRYEYPGDLRERILHEDENYLIVDKPGGIPCHATLDNARENLLSWLMLMQDRPLFITTRLDVPTSGCLVLAKSPAAATSFNKLIMKGNVRKEYEALVEGRCENEGLIRHWMKDENWAPRKVFAEPLGGGLECRLRVLERQPYETVNGEPATLLRIQLETGRTHQIRAQMAALGHPVWNDEMYGAPKRLVGERIALRAKRLGYRDPFTGEMRSFSSSKCWWTDPLENPAGVRN